MLSVGYRHFMFEPCFTQVLADTLQEYAGDEDIFLTLRVSARVTRTSSSHSG